MNRLTTTLALVVACFALPAASAAADRWAPLREGLEAWTALSFDAKFALNVGDESGALFTWESPGFSMNGTRMEGASLSKWPAATMITGLVNDGTLSFDDKANKHIKWWTKDPLDKRSRVTLRHLLSHTAGFNGLDLTASLPAPIATTRTSRRNIAASGSRRPLARRLSGRQCAF